MTALIEGAARAAAPTRPLVTRDMLARQFERLAAGELDAARDDFRFYDAAERLGARTADFDGLVDTVLVLDEIESGEYRYGAFDDPDVVERLAREKHADALAPLVDAAWAALCGGGR